MFPTWALALCTQCIDWSAIQTAYIRDAACPNHLNRLVTCLLACTQWTTTQICSTDLWKGKFCNFKSHVLGSHRTYFSDVQESLFQKLLNSELAYVWAQEVRLRQGQVNIPLNNSIQNVWYVLHNIVTRIADPEWKVKQNVLKKKVHFQCHINCN